VTVSYGYDWKPYVPVAERRRKAAREAARIGKKGAATSPVVITGRAIARTFWGKAWCDNLERYSDYANRLPRGRSYVRNGSVLDLQLAPAQISAVVVGSRVYHVDISVAAVARPRWTAICHDCAGAIDSLVELLQGRLSRTVMERICRPATGLFPQPAEISFTCTCPDWASMCKHVAAVLYGVGARLDERPELLFLLRKVDQADLIASAGAAAPLAKAAPPNRRVLPDTGLSELFGLDLATAPPAAARRARTEKRPDAAGRSARAAPKASPQRAAAQAGRKATAPDRIPEAPANRRRRPK
jgi:uncharacterized Zn finger protein